MSWETAADVLVVGSGVAGLTAALRAHERGLRVLLVSKGTATDGNTGWAQGGVAVVSPEVAGGDSVSRHVRDTLDAGAGLCSKEAVRTILGDGADAVARLRETGARFDGDDDVLLRTREGGHSAFRVIHAGGDATGAEVQRALGAAAAGSIAVLERHCVVELLHGDSGAVAGALVLDALSDLNAEIKGKSVVCVTSGGNFDFERLPEVKERAMRFSGRKKYFILRMPQRPGALREFLDLLGPDDDIARFEYLKKSARNFGTVLIGIEAKKADGFPALFQRMTDQGFEHRDITSDPVLSEFLI